MNLTFYSVSSLSSIRYHRTKDHGWLAFGLIDGKEKGEVTFFEAIPYCLYTLAQNLGAKIEIEKDAPDQPNQETIETDVVNEIHNTSDDDEIPF